MNHITRMKIARLVGFLRPAPARIPLSVNQVLDDPLSANVVSQFNRLYYESGCAGSLRWRDVEILKNPCDLWMLLELLQRVRPAVLVETGTHYGGSALYFAEMSRLLGQPCSIITIDINPKFSYDPEKHGVFPVVGYSTDPAVVAKVKNLLQKLRGREDSPVMVTLDSDHSEENVTQELQCYSPLVTLNSYLIVEDTHINGHPVSPGQGPGPWEAVEKFLLAGHGFERDLSCERHLLTFFPNGWLKRVGV